MQVKLINHTTNPEKMIIQATRTCYQSFPKQNETSDMLLLKHIVIQGESPLEFASFTFDIQNVSRALSHQLVRHRMASFAQKSQRYCAEVGFSSVIPPAIKEDEKALHIYKDCILEIQKQYNKLKAAGIRNEDARYVLPNACTTHLVCNMNARSLRNFILLRTSKRAQWEIRELAMQMLNCMKPIAPVITGILTEMGL